MLIEGYMRYIRANRKLRRKELKLKNTKSHLMARNWFQVKNSGSVYAISTILKPGQPYMSKGVQYTNQSIRESVSGGTAYAVQMAIDIGRPVFVFNLHDKRWYEWSKDSKSFVPIETPVLTPNFAAIGTRELSPAGEQAIREVYQKTLAQLRARQMESLTETPGEIYTIKIKDNTFSLVVKEGVVVTSSETGQKYIGMTFIAVL
jgi:hypothetical protein